MGIPKGLALFQNQHWLTWQIKNFFRSGGENVLIVFGSDKEIYQNTLPWLRHEENDWFSFDDRKVAFVVNHCPVLGQFSSIQTGLQVLCSQDVPGCFVQPIDVPIPDQEVFQALSTAKKQNVDAVMPTHQGKGGHPVLLAKTFMDYLLNLPVDEKNSRLDRQINSLPSERLIKTPVIHDTVCLNLNTPS